jgi:hypothetical protein
VNYVYEIDELEHNAAAYGRRHEVRAAPAVVRLARLAAPLGSLTPNRVPGGSVNAST